MATDKTADFLDECERMRKKYSWRQCGNHRDSLGYFSWDAIPKLVAMVRAYRDIVNSNAIHSPKCWTRRPKPEPCDCGLELSLQEIVSIIEDVHHETQTPDS